MDMLGLFIPHAWAVIKTRVFIHNNGLNQHARGE